MGARRFRKVKISIRSHHARGDRPLAGRKGGRIFQSAPLMRGETVVARGFQPFPRFQSAPLMRGETAPTASSSRSYLIFQSAPLMRGETLGASLGTRQSNFNPLPSCEGRLTRVCTQKFVDNFNPLPSCEGRLTSLRANSSSSVFQSAPLMRGET